MSKLIVAKNFNFLRKYGRSKGVERMVTDPVTGEKTRVWIDDSRTVKQVEHDESMDAIVYPQPIRVQIKAVTPQGRAEVRKMSEAIAAALAIRKRSR